VKIWIFQIGEPLHIDSSKLRPMRAINLSNKLIEAGHEVVIWSSSFSHQEKKHRSIDYKIINVNDNLEIRLVPSIGYTKHLSFRRIFDHIQLSLKLKKILSNEKNLPDVAFLGYPPIEFSAVASRWLRQKSIPSVLDVKDLWPQIFVDALPKFIQPIGKIIFYPYFYYARRTINDVSAISSMTSGFLQSFLSFSERQPKSIDHIFRLTSPIQKINHDELVEAKKWWSNLNIDKSRINFFFVGTFSRNFDFNPIADAAYKAQLNGKGWRFILCGNGPKLDGLKKRMKHLDNVFFPGWVDAQKINALGKMSVATIAPYINVDNFINNIPNKVVDSLALGLPILSPLKGEVESLIKHKKVGMFYDKELSLYQCIDNISNNKSLQKNLSNNAYKTYVNNFEFNKVYEDFVVYLEKLAKIQIKSLKDKS